jgi:capsular polysaccharide biosynthesis protein/MinD-like ATPase involved in chromosome partitioning or flagellar assembly
MTEHESFSFSVRRYASVLKRQWLIVVLVPVLALTAAVGYVNAATPIYEASAKVVVGQGNSLFAPGLSVDVTAFTQTISNLFSSNVVAQQTINDLGLKTTPTRLLSNLNVASQPNGAVLNVTYTDPNKQRAVRVLSTLGAVFTSLVDTKLAGSQAKTAPTVPGAGTQPVSAVVFDPSHLDPGAVSPKVKTSIAVAVILGIVGGILLALFRDAVSSSIKSEAEAEAAYGARSIGSVPRGTLGMTLTQVALLPNKSRVKVTEAMNMLAARLRYSASVQHGVIVVTGARPEDGKTTIVAHLGAELAAAGNDVIVVEADLHRPALNRLLGQPAQQPGVREIGAGVMDPVGALVEIEASLQVSRPPALEVSAVSGVTAMPRGSASGRGQSRRRPRGQEGDRVGEGEPGRRPGRLRLLPAGSAPGNPMNLLSLGNVSSLIAALREEADYVIVDTPPLLLAGEAYPLIQLADAVVVVCRRGSTRHHDATRAREILDSLNVRNYSVALTEADTPAGEYYGYAGY